jgi:hypothetical protein
MAENLTVEEIADKMYEIIVQYAGKKLLKPMDMMKMMQKEHGADRSDCKKALQILTTDGRCVYEYAGGSYIKPTPK